MTYIISPSWVYWTGICNASGIILGIIAIFSGITVAACIVARIVFTFSDYEKEYIPIIFILSGRSTV